MKTLFQIGDLVKWISDWHIYAVDSLGDVHGEKPNYSYGIVIESNAESDVIVVYCHNMKRRYLVNLNLTDCQIISHSRRENLNEQENKIR
jgi:hypothetical protein